MLGNDTGRGHEAVARRVSKILGPGCNKRFNARFRHRVELRQPSERALRWLAKRNDALINRAEITLDLIFKYRADAEEALRAPSGP
jgi:hypothetical protein